MALLVLNLRDFVRWQLGGIRRAMVACGQADEDGPTQLLVRLVEHFVERGEHERAFQFLMVFNVQSEEDEASFDLLTAAFEGIPACADAVNMFVACTRADPEAN